MSGRRRRHSHPSPAARLAGGLLGSAALAWVLYGGAGPPIEARPEPPAATLAAPESAAVPDPSSIAPSIGPSRYVGGSAPDCIQPDDLDTIADAVDVGELDPDVLEDPETYLPPCP